MELFIAHPPPAPPDKKNDADPLLAHWATEAKLLEAAGPLLAEPGHASRRALQRLTDELLGPDLPVASPAGTEATSRKRPADEGDDLPPGWERRESRSKPGNFFFKHTATGHTQVDRPKPDQPTPKKPAKAANALGSLV